MLLVGLTGGIGAGKSTVAGMLAERGAVVIDADDLARRAIEPGTPGFDSVVEAFGRDIVGGGGQIDRNALAAHVFSDPDSRRRLEAIIHPEVARLFVEASEPYRDTDRVVVYVVPLLVEVGLQSMFDVVVAVVAAAEARASRLAAARELSPEEIQGRMEAQLPDEERERAADVLIRNDGSMADLERRVEELWVELARRAIEK